MARDISNALMKCQEYAQHGYELANNGYDVIMETLEKERKRVAETERQQNRLKRGEWSNADVLRRQKRDLEKFSAEAKRLQQDMIRLHEAQKEFTVLVFGRTMVGKSTLMEILTHGEGKSIGNGTQRTTRDVREYHWNGLKVIDVPGIASFDGKEDDDIALAAAKSADLIMFLISDDGVQSEEAKHFASLLSFGKPVLGLINIKVGISDEPRSLDYKRIEKKMGEANRIKAICDQFKAYASAYEQDWENLTFVPTHLKAAYIGQGKNKELWNLSNFEDVEEYMLEKVEKDGAFLRVMTFVNEVAKPMQARLESIIASSSENLQIGLEYRRKCNDLYEWKGEFFDRTQNKFNSFMERLNKKVENAIYDFSERNYENESAGEAWKNYLKQNVNIEGECTRFIKEIGNDFKSKQRELLDDLQSDLSYAGVTVSTSDITGESVIDTQSLAQIGVAIATLLGPVGWIAGGLGFLATFLFESKEEKIRKQKKALRDKLNEAMDGVMEDVGDKVLEVLNDNILHKGVDGLLAALDKRDDMMMELADDESSMAYEMAGELKALNNYLYQEAEEYLGMPKNEICDIAKVPGIGMYVFGSKNYTNDELKRLSSLLMDMGKFNYNRVTEGEKSYWLETARNLLGNKIDVEKIDYGDNGELYVYDISDLNVKKIESKWEYSIIQQLLPMPMK